MTEQTKIAVRAAADMAVDVHFHVEDLLPGEVAADREQLRQAHIVELAPQTAYEHTLAEQLIDYEWELQRHRRLRNNCYLVAYRTFATNTLLRGDPNFNAVLNPLEDDDALLLRDLVGDCAEDRNVAEADFFNKTGWEPAHLLALAVGRSKPAIAHDAKIADLERRRRLLRKDYQDLKATRPAIVDVEDAEYVEDTK